MSKIKAIIFDWHGVLDKVKFENMVKLLSEKSTISLEDTKRILKDECNERGYVTGVIETSTFWRLVGERFHEENAQIAKEMILSFSSNYGLWSVLPFLSSKYFLTILSDCPQDKVDTIKNIVNLSQYFKMYHFSSFIGKSKDDDAFFKMKDIGYKQEEMIYVDDNPKHIETARRLGFKTFLFREQTVEEAENFIKFCVYLEQ